MIRPSANARQYRLLPLLALALGVFANSAPAFARQFTVSAGQSEIVFDDARAEPVRWTVCMPECGEAQVRRAVLFDTDDGYLRIAPAESAADSARPYSSVVKNLDAAVVVEFSRGPERRVYTVEKSAASLTLDLAAGSGIDFATGTHFIPEQLPGFGRIYSEVRPVQVASGGEVVFDEIEQGGTTVQADSSNWTGIRNRYWVLLLQPQDPTEVRIDMPVADQPVIKFRGNGGASASRFRLYAGPVEWGALRSVAPELSEMLFAALWDFLRVLCFGMLLLLDLLYKLVGNYGLAIILLSLSAKILMSPLTMLADRWQADVNRQHTLLKPELDHIKRNFKGEEAHRRVLEVYKLNGVSQFYTFKSAAGFLIQIPVFIAAFDMLAENIVLDEIPFLWIQDLAKPDRLVELPFVLPFFGGWLNLLPFLMTGLSILAAWLQADTTLSADLQRQQSVRLYLMSAAFFVLFYTFPAGMVLYWTSSNLFHLVKVESARVIKNWRQRGR